eukprot:CAMPEP_0113548254 /NCGR_PEP_ID=MMETSP0015_2-20120614/12794_1 /TAXON_ID=2838 /ORGANISM="Odontella" /LENGTH=814 /DNA_ID=CAMNT_0000448869 /DNA_START=245 /DNA_END=2689 /DNA_ORIENTATION=- /assembly_acc=CAM_ASM_000160
MRTSFAFLALLASTASAFQFMKNWKLPSRSKANAEKLVQERFGDKKLVVLAGADSELGQKTVKSLLDTGDYHVVGGVSCEENLGSCLKNDDFTPLLCNMDSFQSVREFCKEVEDFRLGKSLDRLVCYAPTSVEDQLKWSQDGHEHIMQSKFLSPFLMTGLLLDSLEASFDARLTLVCDEGSDAKIADLKDLSGFEGKFEKPVTMADGATEFNADKAKEDAKLCQKLLTHFLHEKYHKLNHVSFSNFQVNSEKNDGLFHVIHDQKGAQKSGISWTTEGEKLVEFKNAAKAYDLDTAYKLFHLSQKLTDAQWPQVKVVNSPCPTLKVIGAVTKGKVKKQELKRMRELGRPGISEPEVIKPTKRQKVIAFADKAVSFVAKNTVGRVAKVATSKMLGEFPEEALQGSFDEISDTDIRELEAEIFAQITKEEVAKEKIDPKKKLVVITGASSGLGRKTALALLRTGDYHVIGAVRDLDKMEAVAELDGFDLENFTPMYCEMNSFESVREFCKNVDELRGDKPLDRLICNAGVYQPSLRLAKWSKDGHEQTMQINFLSHFLIISLLMNGMAKSDDPRVTMVGSVTGNDNTVGGGGVYPIADLHDLDGFKAGFKKPVEMADGYGFIGAKAYKDSKLCLMILGNFLHAKYHESTGIAFSTMYPGCIAESPLFREKRTWFRKFFPLFMKFITGGFVGEHEAGQRLFQVMHDPRCKKSGVYWSWNGGPREGRGAEALEKGGQISGGGGAGGGWNSIFENDQSGKVLNIDTGFKLFEYATKITDANWPNAVPEIETTVDSSKVIDVVDMDGASVIQTNKNATVAA